MRAPVLFLALALTTGCVGKKKYDQALQDLADASALGEEQKTALADAQARIQALEAELDAVTTKADGLDELATSLESRNDTLSRKLVEVQEALAEMSSRSNKRKKELETLVEELQSAANQAAKDARSARDRLAVAEAEAEKLRAEKEELAQQTAAYEALASSLESEIQAGTIRLTELSGKLTVGLSNAILFESGAYDVKREGQEALDRVAAVLADQVDREVRVEGHTDNVPVSAGASYADNWALSSLRASAVVSLLVEDGLDPKHVAAVGFGEHSPLGDNTTPEGKAANRRIEIVLVPRLETRPATQDGSEDADEGEDAE
jgi:chemotaxis protein MotB